MNARRRLLGDRLYRHAVIIAAARRRYARRMAALAWLRWLR